MNCCRKPALQEINDQIFCNNCKKFKTKIY